MKSNKNKVAFLGPSGTFSEAAGLYFVANSDLKLVPYETIFDAIKAVENEETEKAVVPIENSIEGSITTTMDLLVNSDVLIEKEIDLPIVNNLLVLPGAKISKITDVISHPQPIAQCQNFLRTTWPKVNTHKADSTADAASLVAKWKKPNFAAIGHANLAKLYGLEIAASNINDYKGNMTRFVVIGQDQPKPSGKDKTSMVFSLAKDQPGSLYKVLGEFAKRKLNLTKIESRPAKKEIGDYLFFIDLEGSVQDKSVAEALEIVQDTASFFKLLGSYPKGVVI
ncbi:MAG: prephenate dehydratase [Candidatus Margulisiibacteriota bacterium]|jgi:prephenate dehydratase